MANRKVTESDIDDLKYMWKYKGDIENLSSLEDFKEDLKDSYPEIWKAWKDLKGSEAIMNLVMEGVQFKGE